jgi:hypothetical protein
VIHATGGARLRALRAATLARAALGLLVAASVAAFFYAQALKREDPLLKRPKSYTDTFQPSGARHRLHRAAHFDVRASVADVLDISVVTPSGRHVDVIANGLHVREYRSVPLHWDGRTTAGTPAPPGLYELQVRFELAGQTLIAPGFRLLLKGSSG